MPDSPPVFDRARLEHAFERLGELAAAADKRVDISVYGGSALVLTTDFRVGTQDIDAVFEQDRPFIRNAARTVADEFGWPETWINDGVKGFLSAHDSDSQAKTLFRSYPNETGPGLRVFVATPAYLFAMKCLAMRTAGAERTADVDDIRGLGAALGIRDASDALKLVMKYYPAGRISPRTRFASKRSSAPGHKEPNDDEAGSHCRNCAPCANGRT